MPGSSAQQRQRTACPIEGCRESFTNQNRARHMRAAHGIETGSDEYKALFESALPVKRSGESDPFIDGMIKPLRDEVRRLAREIEKLDEKRTEARTKLARYERMLRQLDPTSFVARPKNASPNGSPEAIEAKRKAVFDFIEQNKERYADGFTAAGIYRDMKAAKVEPISSADKILRIVEEMHANGAIRGDRKIRGGAMQYKLITSTNGG